jgi:sporulation protein YlmC with PRC-barrel domain
MNVAPLVDGKRLEEVTVTERHRIIPAETLGGERIVDCQGNDLGTIDDLILDVADGRVAYAVIAGEGAQARRLAVPWRELTRDDERRCYVFEPEA